MNKAELITAISEKSDISKKDIEKVLKSFEEVVKEELASGGKIQLVGFMTLEISERKEREGRNPRTNEIMVIPASKVVKFKAGKALKDSINGDK